METFQPGFEQANPAPANMKQFPFDERLSSWEMSQLWVVYEANSSMKCILQYFVATAQDPEIKTVLDDAFNMTIPQLDTIGKIFNSVGFPIPHGFSDEDVKPNAKRLYSDGLMLTYLKTLNKFGLVKLGHVLPLVTRPDIRAYANSAYENAQNLLNKVEDTLTKKGITSKPPYTPVPDRVNYLSDADNVFGGLLGRKRPINVVELTHVFDRLETKLAERAILLGYIQVATDPQLKTFFTEAKDILSKEIDRWSKVLNDEDLPLPASWRGDVTDSTESPYSDKLMLFHYLLILGISITANVFGLANSFRTDLINNFGKATLDLITFNKKGLELMIKNRWIEEIPLAPDRNKISGLNH
ncbi:Protein of unknown function (DUF3231) [Desulfosporosinus orientis DSM 765]|uniref:Uncharacterized protein n=1 Tax=Desulfosporosinus orientis (strain ATCC 19365 / DSM 765 / NCIMB 8382 / VKM B-1628 / Singapore I) TaxID=768706 RepID=G7W8Z5_DESOD|nr:DUF3231 family protein [Desulfosporosinus orientis]AET68204.1 Protein of unknown function (DUF3231) [Desulfosporosinus orientis DSM 765]